jgi:hypothetical protein
MDKPLPHFIGGERGTAGGQVLVSAQVNGHAKHPHGPTNRGGVSSGKNVVAAWAGDASCPPHPLNSTRESAPFCCPL